MFDFCFFEIWKYKWERKKEGDKKFKMKENKM